MSLSVFFGLPWPLSRRLTVEQLRLYRFRNILAALVIAVGVAMGLAIDLVNQSALHEFRTALASVNGQADASLRPASKDFNASVYETLLQDPSIASAAPILHRKVSLEAITFTGDQAPSIDASKLFPSGLEIYGIDLFRSAQVHPQLTPLTGNTDATEAWFGGNQVYASPQVWKRLERLGVRAEGAVLQLRIDGARQQFVLAGRLHQAGEEANLLVADLGSLQAMVPPGDRLSRIDFFWKLERQRQQAESELLPRLQAKHPNEAFIVIKPEDEEDRMSNLSRAYRVNLGILALVALLTGVFIVQSNMQLITARQWTSMAILQVLGTSRASIQGFMRFQALLIGLIGSVLGLIIGSSMAWFLMAWTSGDLGAGMLQASSQSLQWPIGLLCFHASLGIIVAWIGSWLAVRSLGRVSPITALKGGQAPTWFSTRQLSLAALALALTGGLCLLPGPWHGVPVGAYLAMFFWLIAGLLLMPILIEQMSTQLSRFGSSNPTAWLAIKRGMHLPQTISLSMTGMIASVALCVAVSLMISSFRMAVSDWLDHVLPADVYARVQRGESSLTPHEQRQLEGLTHVKRLEFQQVLEWSIAADRPPVSVIIRSLPLKTPQDRLPITGRLFDAHPKLPSVWVSEAMRDLYDWQPGTIQKLALLPQQDVFVAGVWRDYARQHGSLIIESTQWLRARGMVDALDATDISWWFHNPSPVPDDTQTGQMSLGVEGLIKQIPTELVNKLEIRSASAIRSLSLEIFDRSFLVTYALQAVALLIGLLGLSSTLAAQAMSRTQEFSALQLLGFTPGACVRLLLLEAGSSLALALIWGTLLGLALAWILIGVVNPQSFHWSMPMRVPLTALSAALIAVWLVGLISVFVLIKSILAQPMLQNLKQDW